MTPQEKAVVQSAIYLRYCIESGTAGDPPRLGRLLADVGALIFSCSDCNGGGHVCPGDGNGIAHGEADCGQHDDRGRNTGEPRGILNVDPAPVIVEWMPATFLMCLAGDRIRIGTEETDVLRSSSGVWHVNTEKYWHPTPWKHTELRMDLDVNPGFQQYPPNTACEILCTPERAAVLLLMQTFPGATVDNSTETV